MATENSVFLGNGCEEVLDDEEIKRLRIVPINIYHEGVTAASNFLDLVENRAPCQAMRAAHMRAEMDDVHER